MIILGLKAIIWNKNWINVKNIKPFLIYNSELGLVNNLI